MVLRREKGWWKRFRKNGWYVERREGHSIRRAQWWEVVLTHGTKSPARPKSGEANEKLQKDGRECE